MTAALERLLLAASLLATSCGGRASTTASEASVVQTIERSPAEDRERSPYTGWTRAHYQAVFGRLLLGFVDHRSWLGARTRYPGGEQLPAAMEGAIRMLPALGAWLACACNPDRIRVDGRELDVTAIARAIVVNGTDPTSPDYWKPIRLGWDQRVVEAAMVAEFLVRSRERVWDRLSPREQQRIMAWLAPAEQPLAANWLAFQIARNAARGALGHSVPERALAEQLDRLERDYAGDGFYRDGHQHRFDWYNALVVHAQLSFWRSLAGADQRERVDRVAARTREFFSHLPYLFDAEGRAAPIGRSLAYRSGVLASLHASMLAGDEFLAAGLARRISAGNLRFHVEAGMFDEAEVLTRGYHGEQPGVIDNYLRPGSQYFVSHALSVLALPPEHPFWTSQELPLPADQGDFVHSIPAIGWMITHDAKAGGLILHNVGSSATPARYYDQYAKLEYASHSWYARSNEGARPADALVVSASAGRFDKRRSAPQSWAVAPGFAWLRYAIAAETGVEPGSQPADAGERAHWISTATLADPAWVGSASVRLSCVQPSTLEPARAYQGSHALALGATPRMRGDERTPWLYLDSGDLPPSWGAGAVLLASLSGWERVGRELDLPSAVEHALGGPAGYVGLGVHEAFEQSRCFASLQVLDDQPFAPEPFLAAAPEVEFSGSQATISNWAGTRAWVELAREPSERTIELGGVRASGPVRLLWVGAARVVAVGVRELSDQLGMLLEPGDARDSIVCERERTSWRCERD